MKPLLALAIVAACAGCTKSGVTPIVVYSPHGKEMLSSFANDYERSHPGEAVQWLDMAPSRASELLEAPLPSR